MKIAVIILNYKGKKDTEECLFSLSSSSYQEFTSIIVDNASQDGSIDYLKERFPCAIYLENTENLGYAGGNNVGIRYALENKFDASFVLNNDTILSKTCIEEFSKASKNYPDAILGGHVYQYYKQEKLQHLGGIWNQKRGKFISLPSDLDCITEKWKEAVSLDFIVGCALFVPSTIFQKVGLFDESFFLHYEEIDFCIRAKKAGFSCLSIPGPILWHKEAASIANPRPPQMYYQTRNRILFLKRNLEKNQYLHWIVTKCIYRTFLCFMKYLWKNIACGFYFIFYKKGLTKEKKIARHALYASLLGTFDYFRGKLGKGPDSIFYT